MNRIAQLDQLETRPRPKLAFSDAEALELLIAYRKDPSSLPCPRCGPGTIEVLAFIKPEIDPNGFAVVSDPDGEYAAALYCRTCQRGIGILPGPMDE